MTKLLVISDIRSNSVNGVSTGHYVPVARMYAKLFAGIVNVKVAGGTVYANYFSDTELLSLPYSVSHTSLLGRLNILKNCRALFGYNKGNIIVMQHSAVVTALIGIFLFYHGNSNLYMILYNNEAKRSFISRCFFGLVKTKISGIICPNDDIGRLYNLPYCVVPDYIYVGDSNKQPLLAFEDKTYDFCIVGRIAPGKGVVECARKLVGSHYKILIAGKPENEILENALYEVCRKADNITLRFGYVSDEDYSSYLSQSRYTILNYQGEYSKRSSGVVYDTIFAGVPVIGCRCSALQFVEDEHIGYLYDSLDDFDVSKVMKCERYNDYLKAIDLYRAKHKEYRIKLEQFLKIKE
ncbi:MAG: hypothetical protein Q4E63_03865 [Prevotellaceae bacterium]|nr:hypothetical protein [Prevotellaceae bacterium]